MTASSVGQPVLPPVVDVAWLVDNASDPRVVILDASIFPINRDDEIIPGARNMDIDVAFSDQTTGLPHSMPSAEQFQNEAQALGINSDSVIVVYDSMGLYSAARAWWMFKAMGHNAITVLDGGLPAWKRAGYKVASKRLRNQSYPQGNFVAHPQPDMYVTADEVERSIVENKAAVVDARSEERFVGTTPEPRAHVRAGHIPGAVNLPFADLLDDGCLRSKQELEALISKAMGPYDRMITSCGSGITACILNLAAEFIGKKNHVVYDGSWTEWGSSNDYPIAAGR